jgi:hypothetical protein
MEPRENPDEWTPAPEEEPPEKMQTHGIMPGRRYFERAGRDEEDGS